MNNIHKTDQELFETGEWSDVVVRTKTEDLKLHLAILQRVEWFKTAVIFNSINTNTQYRTIDLTEDDPILIRAMLKFIYSSPSVDALDDCVLGNWFKAPYFAVDPYIEEETMPIPEDIFLITGQTDLEWLGEQAKTGEREHFHNFENLYIVADYYGVTPLMDAIKDKINRMFSARFQRFCKSHTDAETCEGLAEPDMIYYVERIFDVDAPVYMRQLQHEAAFAISNHISCVTKVPEYLELLEDRRHSDLSEEVGKLLICSFLPISSDQMYGEREASADDDWHWIVDPRFTATVDTITTRLAAMGWTNGEGGEGDSGKTTSGAPPSSIASSGRETERWDPGADWW